MRNTTPILTEAFEDPSGRWGGETKREWAATDPVFDRNGQPIDDYDAAPEQHRDFPYGMK